MTSSYYSTQKRPPPPRPDLVGKISKIGPIYKCLEEALEDITSDKFEISGSKIQGINTSLRRKKIKLDESFKAKILQSYTDAVTSTRWDKDTNEPPHDRSSTNLEGKNITSTAKSIGEKSLPPAALIRGRLEHFNRIGGQWRIVVSDAEIRPRVSTERKKKRGVSKLSLWDASEEYLKMERKKRVILGEEKDSSSDWAMKLDDK
eukprot:CAMPEP_0184857694 /NCGR_PEP_ID=MMETSP0580-20130426/2846_1 /TAXON_ID=1118495 /ORGANISM="Dactyliosolen fragilissimus" /LENGTH=203 /DNA_ID=CAMNT_0027353435 /DNA_START=118 /DNA_END=726 /DNA_ORIENTATION=-